MNLNITTDLANPADFLVSWTEDEKQIVIDYSLKGKSANKLAHLLSLKVRILGAIQNFNVKYPSMPSVCHLYKPSDVARPLSCKIKTAYFFKTKTNTTFTRPRPLFQRPSNY